jgi:hypothetical protein
MALKLISVHFPKVGGSSLRSALEATSGEPAVPNDDSDDPADPCRRFNLDPHGCIEAARATGPPDHVEVLHGHFHISKFLHYTDAMKIAFLRHPVENLISIYY